MPDEVLNKIKYLCSKIAKVEWSGVLFYTIEGSIKNPDEMIITLKDILPMDKGTAGYTSFNIDNRFIDFLMDNPDYMDYKTGLIHSHNTMNVFFSGTDMDELKENSFAHNFYLSLIVNNYMEFTAKVGMIGKIDRKTKPLPFSFLDENGEKYNVPSRIPNKSFEIEKNILFTYDCDIISSVETIIIEDSFKNTVDELLAVKPISVIHNNINSFPIKDKHVQFEKKQTPFFQQPFQKQIIKNEAEEVLIMLLSLTTSYNKRDVTLEKLLINSKATQDEIHDYFEVYFLNCFEKVYNNCEEDAKFIECCNGILDILKSLVITYPFLQGGILYIEAMLVFYKEEVNG